MSGKAGDELKIGYFRGSEDKEVITAVVTERVECATKEGLLRFAANNELDCLVIEDSRLIGQLVDNNLKSVECGQMLIPYETVVSLLQSLSPKETIEDLLTLLGVPNRL